MTVTGRILENVTPNMINMYAGFYLPWSKPVLQPIWALHQ